MIGIVSLDDFEREYLQQILGRFSDRAEYIITLDSLLCRWDTFVKEVEAGYGDSIYEYANDASVRGLLQEIEDEAPPSLRRKLAHHLESLDRRFVLATEQTSGRIPGLDRNPSELWSNRVPKDPIGELAKDLRAAGYSN